MIPFGPEVSIFGHRTPLQLTDFPVAVLYVLAVASIGIYGIVLAGWSSRLDVPAARRRCARSAQMISYEIAMGLSFVAVFLYAGSMSTSEIVAAQQPTAGSPSLLFPSFVIYVVSMVGETNRAPFDLPEAEGELVGGFHTEYSLAEVRAVLPRRVHQHGHRLGAGHDAVPRRLAGPVADLAVGRAPTRAGGRCSGSSARCCVFMFVFIWLRGTLPRLRYDQFMKLGWKVLIPVVAGLDR